MSTSDFLFVRPPEGSLRETAETLARELDGRVHEGQGDVYLYADIPWQGRSTTVGGRFEENVYSEPSPRGSEDHALFDGCPYVWRVELRTRSDLEQLPGAGVALLRLVAEHLPTWRFVQTLEFEELLATHDPEQGVREFPRGTRSGGTTNEFWY